MCVLHFHYISIKSCHISSTQYTHIAIVDSIIDSAGLGRRGPSFRRVGSLKEAIKELEKGALTHKRWGCQCPCNFTLDP